jgi:toxin CcdB
MAKYDVYASRHKGRFLLDVQADIIDDFQTRVVVPLLPAATVPPPVARLHPKFEIDGQRTVMATHFLSAAPKAELGVPVANLKSHHDEITAALDMLFQGF